MGQHMNFSNHKHHNCDWSLLECEVGCYNMLTNSSIEIPHKTTNLVIQELNIIWAGYKLFEYTLYKKLEIYLQSNIF